MDLSFKKFQREYYPEYVSWFSDPELNHHLGPMDEDWLSAILSEEEDEGLTWAVFLNLEMVGVVETRFDPQKHFPVAITAIAVKPARRRQGLAKAILEKLLSDHYRRGFQSHCAFIQINNEASRHLFEGIGFKAVSEPDHNGYIEYRHHSRESTGTRQRCSAQSMTWEVSDHAQFSGSSLPLMATQTGCKDMMW